MKMNRRYLLRFFPGMILSMILLPFCIGIAKALPEDNLLRYPIAVLPVLPIGFVFWAVIENVRELDEMKQRIHLEACWSPQDSKRCISFWCCRATFSSGASGRFWQGDATNEKPFKGFAG